MASLYQISYVGPRTQNWKVKVLVVEKLNVFTNNSGVRLQKVLLMDTQGNEIEGLIWNNHIESLNQTLEPLNTYIIGSALVQPIKQEYLHLSRGMTLQWIITSTTYIRSVIDGNDKITYPSIETTPFGLIPAFIDTNNTVDLIAAVVEIHEPKLREARFKMTELQECKVMDNEFNTLLLALWGDFVPQQGTAIYSQKHTIPIVCCKRLKVSNFAGVTVATTPFSCVMVDIDIPEVRQMRKWVSKNLGGITRTKIEETEKGVQGSSQMFTQESVTKIADIKPDTKPCRCEVRMSVRLLDQKLCYSACPKCSHMVHSQSDQPFYCYSCKEEVIGLPRCRVSVELRDDSSTIVATVFDTYAEELLHVTCKELHQMNSEALDKCLEDTEQWLQCRDIIVEIRAVKKKYSDNVCRYTVQKWILKNDVNPCIKTKDIGSGSNSLTIDDLEAHTSMPHEIESNVITAENKKEEVIVPARDATDVTTPKKRAGKDKMIEETTPSVIDTSPLKKLKIHSPTKSHKD